MSNLADQLRATVAPKLAANGNLNLTALQREAAQALAAEGRREEANTLAARLAADVLAPQLADFQEVIEGSGLLRAGEIKAGHAGRMRRDASAHTLTYAAAGNRATCRFQIRLAARPVPAEGGAWNIELSGECVTNGIPDFSGRTTWHPLVALPRKILVFAEVSATETAEAWCTEILKLSAAALMHADAYPGQPLVPAAVANRAPVAAPPTIAMPRDVPVTI